MADIVSIRSSESSRRLQHNRRLDVGSRVFDDDREPANLVDLGLGALLLTAECGAKPRERPVMPPRTRRVRDLFRRTRRRSFRLRADSERNRRALRAPLDAQHARRADVIDRVRHLLGRLRGLRQFHRRARDSNSGRYGVPHCPSLSSLPRMSCHPGSGHRWRSCRLPAGNLTCRRTQRFVGSDHGCFVSTRPPRLCDGIIRASERPLSDGRP